MSDISAKILKLGKQAIKKLKKTIEKREFLMSIVLMAKKIVFELPNGEITTQYNFS